RAQASCSSSPRSSPCLAFLACWAIGSSSMDGPGSRLKMFPCSSISRTSPTASPALIAANIRASDPSNGFSFIDGRPFRFNVIIVPSPAVVNLIEVCSTGVCQASAAEGVALSLFPGLLGYRIIVHGRPVLLDEVPLIVQQNHIINHVIV